MSDMKQCGTFAAAIFDLDGTLVDSMRIWREVDEEFFARRGMPVPAAYQEEIAHLGFRASAEYTVGKYLDFFIDAFTQYLNDSGISVPEDLSVIQWGERKGCERTSSLPYSLLTEPRSECGHAAVDLISRMFQGEDCSSYKVKITPELIMRNGCSLPRTLCSHLLKRETAYQVCL